jgi:hypothetical protein
VRSKAAVAALLAALDDVRLRPYLAGALAAIGDEVARPALAERLRGERYQVARVAITEALVKLGAGPELRAPLVRFMGTPDPLPDGLRFAEQGRVLDLVGGPRESDRDRLRRFATSGVAVRMIVPKLTRRELEPESCCEHPGTCVEEGEISLPQAVVPLRVLCRVRSKDRRAGEVRVGLREGLAPAKGDHDSLVPAKAPDLDPRRTTTLGVPAVDAPSEVFANLPSSVTIKPGELGEFVVYATQNVDVLSCAVAPLTEELPPPPPEPWTPVPADKTDE